jgi:hypothetical protein
MVATFFFRSFTRYHINSKHKAASSGHDWLLKMHLFYSLIYTICTLKFSIKDQPYAYLFDKCRISCKVNQCKEDCYLNSINSNVRHLHEEIIFYKKTIYFSCTKCTCQMSAWNPVKTNSHCKQEHLLRITACQCTFVWIYGTTRT